MTPSASLLTFIADTGLAGLALAFFKDLAEACRPIAKAFLTESTQIVIPRRRALLTNLLRHLRHVALPVFSFEHREIPACRKSFPAGRK